MNLLTKRCTVRKFTAEDIDSFMEYRNDMDWMRFQGFKGMTKEAYEKYLLGSVSLEDGAQFAVAETATGRLLGDVYLKKENDVLWLGYTIRPAYARQGYASEIVVAVISWADSQGCAMIKAGVLSGNTASVKLLEKHRFSYSHEEDGELIYIFEFEK